ncbi:hypothetical protein [Pseudokineococcus sp. 1T1Z-3]|uniref:hypothetical protein n=1 Tax=Pseudokineococcus sp. 1T1Z-3 TaxID=3132745 RepID=UPI0030B538F8
MSVVFTVLVVAGTLAWLVALGRQALPAALRVPLRQARLADLLRDAVRGHRELARLHDARHLHPPAGRRVRCVHPSPDVRRSR